MGGSCLEFRLSQPAKLARWGVYQQRHVRLYRRLLRNLLRGAQWLFAGDDFCGLRLRVWKQRGVYQSQRFFDDVQAAGQVLLR